MKQSTTLGLLLLFILIVSESQAQDVSGFWLGVSYPADPNQAVYNYTMTINQNGNVLGGTTETSNPNVPFGGLAYLSGQIASNQVSFSEADKNGLTSVKGICFWRGKLTYDPTEESLTGTYENMTNSNCTTPGSGKVELYRVVLKSPTKYCKGSSVNLIVTGRNIQWYSSPNRTNPIAKGNTYSPTITQTTTFYITQTLYKNESPAIPVTIEVTEPAFTAIPTSPGCGRTSGSIALTATAGSTGWQYSLNGGAFQATPLFSGLGPGTYLVKAKDATGCQSEQSIALMSVSGPTISDLKATPPQCGTANGEVSVVASGGKAPLTYSVDNGSTFQSSPLFSKLAGGTYTFRVRDDNGCESNKAITLPDANKMVVLSSTGLPTTCGQANGSVTMTTSGGSNPIQYSIDSQTYQPGNTFTGLKSGNYVLLARDAAGCTVSQTIRVATSTGPQVASVQTTAAGCGQPNGTILITSTNAVSTADYSINGQAFQRTTTFANLKAGSYVLTVRDTNNCTVSQNVLVPFDCASTIHLPTAFSPNADHVNDALTVHFGFPSLTILRFTVYDRWGVVLYNRANFEVLNGDSVWDGLVNGQPVPKGVYVYRLDYQLPDGTKTSYRESVALLNE